MDSLIIKGGIPLHGEVAISGAKNAVLPILAATLLTPEPCVIRHVPDLSDVKFMGQILASLGAQVKLDGETMRVRAAKIRGTGNYNLIRKMRGSICILGPLLGRLHRAQVSLPGGCVIGARPIDLHLKGLSALGAKVNIEAGYVCLSAPKLRGAELFLGGRAGPTVLGTANVMMAATLADGVTIIESAACEPEVMDLALFLNAMGAKITGAGSPTVTITGVQELHGAEHDVIPDRIEAATFAIAAAATRGQVDLVGARPDHMHAVLDKLREAGVAVERNGAKLRVRRRGPLQPVDITTQPYAGFPTDVQAQMMVLLALTQGIGIITERIFESRFT
ncbi:MAG: UDP-N-acetylglucosamine 1-carboxyvinyltransferase, partial [Verrucomicrobia bacterium]|nr:UDP-N-acetylglucosamine 1-carboxyvinyltransferase [Verrucomicrobiota bacterium]